MKNLILCAVALISGLTIAQAQSDSKAVQLGVKGGLNSSTISGDDIGELKSRTSFNAGLVAEIPISERVSFQPEVSRFRGRRVCRG